MAEATAEVVGVAVVAVAGRLDAAAAVVVVVVVTVAVLQG